MGPVSSPLPQAVRAGSEPMWLWNLDTHNSSVKPFWNCLPFFTQSTDLTSGLGCVQGTQTVRHGPRRVSGTGMDLDNSKAERTQYLRGHRKGKGALEVEEHCHLEGGRWSMEMVMFELNFEDCVGPGQWHMKRRAW